MTAATLLGERASPTARRERRLNRPAREWLSVLGHLALLATVMSTVMPGPLALGRFMRWLLAHALWSTGAP